MQIRSMPLQQLTSGGIEPLIETGKEPGAFAGK